MAWVAELRKHGVTRVALGDFEAFIDPAPSPPPTLDEALHHERRDLDDIGAL